MAVLGGMFFGAATLVTILTLRRERLPRDRRTWGHLVIAAVFMNVAPFTLFAYILSFSVIRDAGATIATTVTYLLPVVPVLAGIVLLGESVTWNEPLGAAMILIGALITQGRLRSIARRLARGLRAGSMPA